LVAIAAVVATPSVATTATTGTTTPATTASGLYREYCGQCHALKVALSAGFGNASGLGSNGGPSFNNLRVPYSFSMQAVLEPTGGHEIVKNRISFKQLNEVALYIARVTAHHPIPALPTDG
jgi:mono/diheme cytochrome c family protein